MTERGDRLLAEMSDWPLYDIKLTERTRIARAICEHLGIEWEDVKALHEVARYFDVGGDNFEVTGRIAVWSERKAAALATLLEAAGTPEPTEGE